MSLDKPVLAQANTASWQKASGSGLSPATFSHPVPVHVFNLSVALTYTTPFLPSSLPRIPEPTSTSTKLLAYSPGPALNSNFFCEKHPLSPQLRCVHVCTHTSAAQPLRVPSSPERTVVTVTTHSHSPCAWQMSEAE